MSLSPPLTRRFVVSSLLALAWNATAVTAASAENPPMPDGTPDGATQGRPANPEITEQARAVEIVDGDTLVLSDGGEVRLVGIQAPKLPLGRKNFPTWPLAPEARDALEDLALGRTLGLAFGGRRQDRHGRLLAHLYREDGLWLQGEMVSRGLARVYGFADNRALLPELLARERQARGAHLGLWTDPFYAIRSPDQLGDLTDSFQLVEGRVLDVAVVRDRGYLNFGADWRSDFTGALSPETLRLFADEGIDIKACKGRRVRLRGWIEQWNGPLMDVTYPEQIELLG